MSGHTPAPPGASGREVVAAGRTDALPERFENPGLPAHRLRMADVDAKAAKRAERQVATLFGISAIGTLLALVVYFTVKFDTPMSFMEHLSRLRISTTGIGVGLFLALFGIGVGAVHWAKTLMPDEERVEDRHLLRGSDAGPRRRRHDPQGGRVGVGPRPPAAHPELPDRCDGARAAAGRRLLRDTGPMPGNASRRRSGRPACGC